MTALPVYHDFIVKRKRLVDGDMKGRIFVKKPRILKCVERSLDESKLLRVG